MTSCTFKLQEYKICSVCGLPNPATIEFFYPQRHGKYGVTKICRNCHKMKMIKANKLMHSKHRDDILLRTYQKRDEKKNRINDLDSDWIRENITSKPCHYCSCDSEPIGCDRIDNDIGYIKSNVLPCCRLCNITRNENFTTNEMELIGRVIEEIRLARQVSGFKPPSRRGWMNPYGKDG